MPYVPRGKTFDDFAVGEVVTTAARTITEADVVHFAYLSGDWNPLHTDAEYARTTPFGERIAHGALIQGIVTGLANQLGIFEGTTVGVLQFLTKFTGPVRFGDTIHGEITCTDKKESRKPDRGTATFRVAVLNQRGEQVLDGEWIILLTRKTP